MEKDLKKKAEKIAKILGDCDFMLVSHNDGTCIVQKSGDTTTIAHAMFAGIMNMNDDTGDVLYRILKLNVLNILTNPSPYAIDLAESIINVMPKSYYAETENVPQTVN